ncbi:hypothetical protein [Hyphococcus sp.]|uniref:hypothetical protein n=1 Tax=Hyphococcus sp. TaxID=2038636 RepID=UPI0020810869|nr:MAG: hypothetical protein DHS20C04_26510 [Marinicaulis sp.]
MRIAYVGGSNGLVQGGVGRTLEEQLGSDFVNFSLGDSPSLRGVEFLLRSDGMEEFDAILFDYALNDLIFESANTIDPFVQREWLEAMLRNEVLRKRLFIATSCGSNALVRARAGASPLLRNYISLAEDHGVPLIDGVSVIDAMVRKSGAAEVFHQHNHFSPMAVAELCSLLVSSLHVSQAKAARTGSGEVAGRAEISSVTLVASGDLGMERFCTSAYEGEFVNLRPGQRLEIKALEGRLLGFYGLIRPESGFLAIESPRERVVKPLGHMFNLKKPFAALRHLTRPIDFRAGETLVMSVSGDPESGPEGRYDHTQGANAALLDGKEPRLGIGPLIFLT